MEKINFWVFRDMAHECVSEAVGEKNEIIKHDKGN